ncbi:DUF5020 family protein [Paraferrimonas sedimenticola]|uniref:Ion channel protein Tsx n=1 Tax=Paraferrimonas sedimenticola TaxID=375674 RepID=A0AA37RY06_9GAMM|nr:DUF5020 family protein [Paraferrimonas sedimenticola]GLP97253.1 ion channel protein Tsx [Paraferrimonas sedimenticola]
MKKALLALPLIMASTSASAELYFQDYSLTLLRGYDYELGDPKRWVGTFEYVNDASWGDTFFFADRLVSDNGDTEIYGEFSPRFHFMKVDNGPLKALNVATTWEFNTVSNGFSQDNFLLGVGSSWNIPFFRHFGANVYQRFNDHRSNTQQLTLTWGVAVPFSKTEILFDGFMDWESGTGSHSNNLNFTPQIKIDVAPWVSIPGKLYLGFEYVHWNNKFGVKGVNERNWNALVKYHF